MGIPGYTRWLRQRFGGAFHPVVRSKPLGLQCPYHNRLGFDHVHFDLAARLYMVSGRANDTAHLVRLLLRDLHRVVRWTSPRQSVTLAVDGVPVVFVNLVCSVPPDESRRVLTRLMAHSSLWMARFTLLAR